MTLFCTDTHLPETDSLSSCRHKFKVIVLLNEFICVCARMCRESTLQDSSNFPGNHPPWYDSEVPTELGAWHYSSMRLLNPALISYSPIAEIKYSTLSTLKEERFILTHFVEASVYVWSACLQGRTACQEQEAESSEVRREGGRALYIMPSVTYLLPTSLYLLKSHLTTNLPVK